jgi:drug/metabolite transporter (DMT)-like permease
MLGLSQTDAATSSLLLTLEGVFTALLAWVAFREHVTARLVWGMIAIAFGAGVLAWNGAPDLKHASGPLFIAGACLAWAIDNNLTRRIALNDATTIAMLKGLFAGGANLALALSVGAHLPIAAAAPAMLIGFLGYGLSLVLFVKALRELGAGRTSAYFAAAPFVGAMIALGFGAPASANLAVAALFMGAGVWLHLTEHHAHVHLHEEMHHTHEHVHDAHHQHVHQPEDPSGEPHTHRHHHKPLRHSHAHFPDLHHTHAHNAGADKA